MTSRKQINDLAYSAAPRYDWPRPSLDVLSVRLLHQAKLIIGDPDVASRFAPAEYFLHKPELTNFIYCIFDI